MNLLPRRATKFRDLWGRGEAIGWIAGVAVESEDGGRELLGFGWIELVKAPDTRVPLLLPIRNASWINLLSGWLRSWFLRTKINSGNAGPLKQKQKQGKGKFFSAFKAGNSKCRSQASCGKGALFAGRTLGNQQCETNVDWPK